MIRRSTSIFLRGITKRHARHFVSHKAVARADKQSHFARGAVCAGFSHAPAYHAKTTFFVLTTSAGANYFSMETKNLLNENSLQAELFQ